jgi:hypothetical protein
MFADGVSEQFQFAVDRAFVECGLECERMENDVDVFREA